MTPSHSTHTTDRRSFMILDVTMHFLTTSRRIWASTPGRVAYREPKTFGISTPCKMSSRRRGKWVPVELSSCRKRFDAPLFSSSDCNAGSCRTNGSRRLGLGKRWEACRSIDVIAGRNASTNKPKSSSVSASNMSRPIAIVTETGSFVLQDKAQGGSVSW